MKDDAEAEKAMRKGGELVTCTATPVDHGRTESGHPRRLRGQAEAEQRRRPMDEAALSKCAAV